MIGAHRRSMCLKWMAHPHAAQCFNTCFLGLSTTHIPFCYTPPLKSLIWHWCIIGLFRYIQSEDVFYIRGVGLINKSSILTAFSIINHPFGGTPMTMETSISLELIWFDKRRTQQDQGLKPWGAPSPFNASEYKTPWFPVGFLCLKTMGWTNWQLKACKSVAITCHNWEYLLTRHFCQGI